MTVEDKIRTLSNHLPNKLAVSPFVKRLNLTNDMKELLEDAAEELKAQKRDNELIDLAYRLINFYVDENNVARSPSQVSLEVKIKWLGELFEYSSVMDKVFQMNPWSEATIEDINTCAHIIRNNIIVKKNHALVERVYAVMVLAKLPPHIHLPDEEKQTMADISALLKAYQKLKEKRIAQAKETERLMLEEQKKLHRARLQRNILVTVIISMLAAGVYFWTEYVSQLKEQAELRHIEETRPLVKGVIEPYETSKRITNIKDIPYKPSTPDTKKMYTLIETQQNDLDYFQDTTMAYQEIKELQSTTKLNHLRRSSFFTKLSKDGTAIFDTNASDPTKAACPKPYQVKVIATEGSESIYCVHDETEILRENRYYFGTPEIIRYALHGLDTEDPKSVPELKQQFYLDGSLRTEEQYVYDIFDEHIDLVYVLMSHYLPDANRIDMIMQLKKRKKEKKGRLVLLSRTESTPEKAKVYQETYELHKSPKGQWRSHLKQQEWYAENSLVQEMSYNLVKDLNGSWRSARIKEWYEVF